MLDTEKKSARKNISFTRNEHDLYEFSKTIDFSRWTKDKMRNSKEYKDWLKEQKNKSK